MLQLEMRLFLTRMKAIRNEIWFEPAWKRVRKKGKNGKIRDSRGKSDFERR